MRSLGLLRLFGGAGTLLILSDGLSFSLINFDCIHLFSMFGVSGIEQILCFVVHSVFVSVFFCIGA